MGGGGDALDGIPASNYARKDDAGALSSLS